MLKNIRFPNNENRGGALAENRKIVAMTTEALEVNAEDQQLIKVMIAIIFIVTAILIIGTAILCAPALPIVAGITTAVWFLLTNGFAAELVDKKLHRALLSAKLMAYKPFANPQIYNQFKQQLDHAPDTKRCMKDIILHGDVRLLAPPGYYDESEISLEYSGPECISPRCPQMKDEG